LTCRALRSATSRSAAAGNFALYAKSEAISAQPGKVESDALPEGALLLDVETGQITKQLGTSAWVGMFSTDDGLLARCAGICTRQPLDEQAEARATTSKC
jgi:hypothetical protein